MGRRRDCEEGALTVHDHMATGAGEQITADFSTELLPRMAGEKLPINKRTNTEHTHSSCVFDDSLPRSGPVKGFHRSVSVDPIP